MGMPYRSMPAGMQAGHLSLCFSIMLFLNSVRQAPGVRSAMAVAVSVLSAGGYQLASAAEGGTALEPVVVTATRVATPLSKVLSDVTVLDREDIERQGSGGLVDLLRRVPGAEFSRNGGPGGTTSFYLRGAENRFTAVLIDGVRVDSQSTGGAPWEAIPLTQIDRIEIVRGPLSTVYGSDAVGGVVQIFTRKGRQGLQADAQVGMGSHGLGRAQASVGGANEHWDASVGFVTEYSEGFDSTTKASSSHIADNDGYQTHTVNGRLGWKLHDDHRVDVSALSSRWDTRYDSSASKASKADDHSLRELDTVAVGWQARWNKAWNSRLQLTQSDERYQTLPSPYQTHTQVNTYSWQHDVVVDVHTFSAVLERREDKLINTSLTTSPTKGSGDRSLDSLGLGYGLNIGAYSLQLNARQDDDSEFGRHHTGSAAAGWRFAEGWQWRAAVGQAFRVPTLYQRFTDMGKASLRPESSVNYETGLEYRKGNHALGATVYRNEVKNMITYVAGAGACSSAYGCYDNTSQALLKGLTLHGETVLLGKVRLSGSLDVQSPKDLKTDKLLGRRARQHGTVRADTELGNWTLGGEVLASSYRYNTAANTAKERLGGYAVLNLDAQYQLNKDWRVLVKLDNALEKNYQTTQNYNSAPMSVFFGLSWAMDR